MFTEKLLIDEGHLLFWNVCFSYFQAIGYREFDLTPSGIADYIQQLPFPVLSSNIDASKEPALKSALNRSTVLNVGGENIGIVGYTYGDAATNSQIGELPALIYTTPLN